MIRIYFPSSMGQKKTGVDLTSKYIKKLFEKSNNDIQKSPLLIQAKNDQENASNEVRKSLLSHNLIKLYRSNMSVSRPTINIGGDHSMAIATIAASLQKYGSNLKVIWFDAHGDINTRKTSPSGNYHGMPLAFLTGLDDDFSMFPFLNYVPRLKFENILYLGIRDLDDGEKQVLKDKKIKYIKSADINNNGKKSFEIIKAFIGNDPVHLSFDVDGLDPIEMPSTGTTAKKGVHVNAIKPILDKLMQNPNFVNMDITEFNLEIGDAKDKDTSIKNFTKLFQKYL
jgi:arginase